MPIIDFTNIINDREAGYLPESAIYSMKDYFKNKAMSESSYVKSLRYAQKGLLILATYRFGRRVSEMIGKPKNQNYPGLRPCDLMPGKSIITFHILKKHHVKRKTKSGIVKSEESINRELLNKKPKKVSLAVDKEIYNILVRFVKKHQIAEYDRIFPFGRSSCDDDIKEAAKACNIRLSGTRTIKDKITKIPYTIPKRVRYHHLRHSFAVHFLKKNQENPNALAQLMDILCHSSIEVTKSYLQFGQEGRVDFLTRTFAPDKVDKEVEVL